mmetsp:Transcript_1864/g.4292  ORF Transcript_1864/g.4292 Transcript_1864/m.4292 type:complete len:133 (+) Transcript_1864:104-502(+)
MVSTRFILLAVLPALLASALVFAEEPVVEPATEFMVSEGGTPPPTAGRAGDVPVTQENSTLVGDEILVGEENATVGNGSFTVVPELPNPLEGDTITLGEAESPDAVPDEPLNVLLPNNEFDADPDDLPSMSP